MALRATARRVVPLVVLALAAVGCSGGQSDPEGQDAARDAGVDVRFARQSVVQHAEMLLLVDEAARRDMSPPVAAVAEEVRADLTADIEALSGLLEEWGEPVPATARDHAHAGHAGQPEDVAKLRGEHGRGLEEAWLDLMADQHDDALDLALGEVEEGQDDAAVRLAREMAGELAARLRALERLEDRVDD